MKPVEHLRSSLVDKLAIYCAWKALALLIRGGAKEKGEALLTLPSNVVRECQSASVKLTL